MKRLCTLFLCSGAPAFLAAAEAPPQKTVLDSDRAEIWSEGNETHGVCTGSVTMVGTNVKLECDKLEFIALGSGDTISTLPSLQRFKYLVATGHVKIVQGEREATCGRAELFPREDRIELTENPVLTDGGFTQGGEKFIMFRGKRRAEIIKPHLVGPEIKDLGFDPKEPAPTSNVPTTAPTSEPKK